MSRSCFTACIGMEVVAMASDPEAAIQQGVRLIEAGRLVEARQTLSSLLEWLRFKQLAASAYGSQTLNLLGVVHSGLGATEQAVLHYVEAMQVEGALASGE